MTAVDVDALDKLAFVMHAQGYCGEVCVCVDDARALLPIVDRIATERAAAALEAAADWLEADPDKGGAPLITGNFSVLFADRLDIAQAVSWAGASLRDKAAALRASNGAGTAT